jgi:hypothetical protein
VLIALGARSASAACSDGTSVDAAFLSEES